MDHVPDRGEHVCVVGAGAAGLLATKNLLEHGFQVDCYDREADVGGLWDRRHDRSPVLAGTHTVSSRPLTEIPDFPMPDSWPDYPDHRQMASYLQRYADHFGLRPQLWFGTEVVRARPIAGDVSGHWEVTIRTTGTGGERSRRYAAVVVATGQHWSPRRPDYPGMDEFGGEVVHAGDRTDPAALRDRRVLVVGAGNTGCDLAAEAAVRGAACWHSSRRGYWILPKYLRGRPTDQVVERLQRPWLPWRVRQWLLRRLLRAAVGDQRRYRLPAPDHRVLESRPVVNSLLPHYAAHGRLTPVPDIARFHRDGVELIDGRRIDPDLVVFATGYEPRFDLLEPELLGTDEQGRVHLPLHLFTRHPTLAVLGLPQPETGVLPLLHWQAVTFARWLRVREREPGRAGAVWSGLTRQADHRWHDGRVVDSPRHWYEVSRARYLRGLERALTELEPRA